MNKERLSNVKTIDRVSKLSYSSQINSENEKKHLIKTFNKEKEALMKSINKDTCSKPLLQSSENELTESKEGYKNMTAKSNYLNEINKRYKVPNPLNHVIDENSGSENNQSLKVKKHNLSHINIPKSNRKNYQGLCMTSIAK